MSLLCKIDNCMNKRLQQINKFMDEINNLNNVKKQLGGASSNPNLTQLLTDYKTKLSGIEDKVANLNRTGDTVNTNLGQLTREVSLLDTAISSLIEDYTNKKKNLAKMQIAKNVQISAKDRLLEDQKKATEELDSTKNQLKIASSAAQASLTADKNRLEEALKRIISDLEIANKTIEAKDSEIKDLKEDLRKKDSAIAELKGALNSKNSEIKSVEDELRTGIDRLGSLDRKVGQLREVLDNTATTTTTTESKLKQFREKVSGILPKASSEETKNPR